MKVFKWGFVMKRLEGIYLYKVLCKDLKIMVSENMGFRRGFFVR